MKDALYQSDCCLMTPRRSFWLSVSVFLCLLFSAVPEQALARKYAALVMDASTGKVLHSRQAGAKRYPASITKVMTLYMLFEAMKQGRFDMNSRLKVSRKAANAPASKLGLRRGSTIKVKDAIGTLITKSANDVAVVVAEAIAGSEKKFAARMTQKARALGMKNTTFRNASGLHHSKQITTAYDIATLAQRIRKDFPEYYSLFKIKYYTYGKRKFRNHNRLLGDYPGMEGLKTGFINASGFNLVAVAKRNNQRVIAIVFGGKSSKSRNRRVRQLLDIGFSRLPNLSVIKVPLRRGAGRSVQRVAISVPRVPLRTQGALKQTALKTPARATTTPIATESIEIQWQDVTTTPAVSSPVTQVVIAPEVEPAPETAPVAIPASDSAQDIELQFSIIE